LIRDFHVTGLAFAARSLRFRSHPPERERGYVLLTLLLAASLLVIAAAVVAPMITLQIRRDQEEELIHRGMEYRRAIRAYAKHTGNFPLTLDQLEHATGNRYLRRRYKDPITGKDFRLLHMNDIAAPGSGSNTPGVPSGGSANTAAEIFSNASSTEVNPQDSTGGQNAQAGSQGSPTPQAAASPAAPGSGANLGGGVIMGVASSSPKKTIREFNHKNHYKDWLFFYSANYDGSVEVKGPTPSTPVFAAQKNSADSSNQQTPAAQTPTAQTQSASSPQ
jgi:type II secretory pathway pseudopilin PulG